MKKITIALCVLASSVYGGATVLSPAEKAERAHAQADSTDNQTVSEVLSGGQKIRLSDGSLWKIHPKDVDKTGGWLGPADIKISKGSGNPDYPYLITNLWTETTVIAQKINEDNTTSQ